MIRKELLSWSVVPLLALGCGAEPEPVPEPAPPSVLLLSVDTLRPDHMSIYGYERETTPRIDAFFEGAAIYERAYSAEAATAPSVVSMLSGLYPARHGVRLLYQKVAPELGLLPDLLAEAGYDTAGIVSNAVLTAEAIDLASHFAHYDDFVDEKEIGRDNYERRASRTTDAALDWLRLVRDPARPHFLWVHYIDPHGPYTPPDDKPTTYRHEGFMRVDDAKIRSYQRIEGVRDALDYVDRYDEEIAYMDREVGRLFDGYAELGLLDELIVAFTADHGETMIEHDKWFTHGYDVWEAIVRVPLCVRIPGRPGGRTTHPVSLVDLAPTLLEAAGLDVHGGFDGIPLERRPPDSSISVEAGSAKKLRRARIVGDQKWFILVDEDGTVERRGWVQLGQDAESNRGLRQSSDGPEEGFVELEEWVAADPDPTGAPEELIKGRALHGPKVAPGRTEAELEALRKLGYVD